MFQGSMGSFDLRYEETGKLAASVSMYFLAGAAPAQGLDSYE